MIYPRLVVLYEEDWHSRENRTIQSTILMIRRELCHIDTISKNAVLIQEVKGAEPWAEFPETTEIIFHQSVRIKIRKQISSSYFYVVCKTAEDFREKFERRLRILRMLWIDTVLDHLKHWSHDESIEMDDIEEWCNQFSRFGLPAMGKDILKCFRVIPQNGILSSLNLPLTTSSDVFTSFVNMENGEEIFDGGEFTLQNLLGNKSIKLQLPGRIPQDMIQNRRLFIVVDWILSGRQMCDFIEKYESLLSVYAKESLEVSIRAAFVTSLGKIKVGNLLTSKKLTKIKVVEPKSGWLKNLLPNHRGAQNPIRSKDHWTEDMIVQSEFEKRLIEVGWSMDSAIKKTNDCAELGYRLLDIPATATPAERPAKYWGLGNDGLGLTTVLCGSAPHALLPVIWRKKTIYHNDKPYNWKPLISVKNSGDWQGRW